MCLFAFALGWLAAKESEKEDLFIMYHVTKGGCMDDFSTAIHRCHYDKHPDAEACIKATAALRKCFAAKPDHFGAVFTERLDKGLDQDTNPTSQEIEEYERRGKYRWWTGMRRS